MEETLDTQLKTWGNSFGIVVPKALTEKLGLRPGMPIHVTISFEPARNDASKLHVWNFPYVPTRHVLDLED
ncbi:MAG: AbrB/MazE/SpoVT family DNA-binding domain-containing protein [Thermoplasmatota archaeon]